MITCTVQKSLTVDDGKNAHIPEIGRRVCSWGWGGGVGCRRGQKDWGQSLGGYLMNYNHNFICIYFTCSCKCNGQNLNIMSHVFKLIYIHTIVVITISVSQGFFL